MSDVAPVPIPSIAIERHVLHTRRGKRHAFLVGTAKRLVDTALVFFLAPILLPSIATLWCLARLDGGPGFYGHVRVGRGGQIFKCWKIRSMVPDADARLADHLAVDSEAAAEWARDQKLTSDPRITQFGHFIRMTSLDELPQIWNVLVGDMSFVGPRPVTAAELRRYGLNADAYLDLRPGITGLWQVSGRNLTTYEERVALDIHYRRSASLLLDAQILAWTALAVLKGTGR